ncbi:hypothetical protein LTR56_020285 [Elasticomyces elasticus]|nr:hypothetical protein LTR56_020285 [Elasticomyces elasticus]KAK3644553.1 hypothetical protein LTR22_015151 [Elasticomyces elasticus]KAK4910405.1 hypothetical protein LTR49_020921 [Elasticomyces elasticus]KAK5750070.1 hypothetical protein LTS12_019875 [Elasticomyces elasticus]
MNPTDGRAGTAPYRYQYPLNNDNINLTLYARIHDPTDSNATDQVCIIVTADTTFLNFQGMVEACYMGHWIPEALYAYSISTRWDATFGGNMLEESVARLWRWTQDHIAAGDNKPQDYCALQTITRPQDLQCALGVAEWDVRHGCIGHKDGTFSVLPIPPLPPRRGRTPWTLSAGNVPDRPRACVAIVPDVKLWATFRGGSCEDDSMGEKVRENCPTSQQRVKSFLRKAFGVKRRREGSSMVERSEKKLPA